jgi:hypothetical protein
MICPLQSLPSNRDDWQVEGEYDPMWPNDYEKVVIGKKLLFTGLNSFMVIFYTDNNDQHTFSELKEKREREKLKEEDERRKRRGEMPRPRDS